MTPERKRFNKDGYFIAKGVLAAHDVDQVNASLQKTLDDQLAARSIQVDERDLFTSLRALFSHDISLYKKLVGSLWRKHDVFSFLHSKSIVQFLRDKFGWSDFFLPGGQVVHLMAHALRIPNGYFGFVPHQDFPSVQGSLDGVVVWIPLVNVDKDNFPLEVIRESHRLGLLPMIDHNESTREVRPECYSDADFVPVEVSVGDVVFMSVFTIHRSSQTGGPDRFRLALSTRFDNADEATFVQRAYPTAFLRSVHRDQYFPDFPSQEQVRALFPVD